MIRVATWNIRHARPQRGLASNRRLVDAVTMLDVDVLAVQEVERRVIRSWFADQPTLVARAAGAIDHRYAPARRLALTGSDGVALCSRERIVDSRVTHIDRRVVLLARTESTSFACTHLFADATIARRQLDRVLDVFAGWPRPRVLLGDLNLSTDDVREPLTSAGFTIAGGGPTEPAWNPIQRIDHIAVDGLDIVAVDTPAVPVSDHRPVLAELR